MAKFADAHPSIADDWPWTIKTNRTRWGDLLWQVLIEFTAMTALVLLILATGGVAGIYWAVPALNDQSRAFADAEVSAIAASWDEALLMSAATPRLRASSYDGYDRYFASLRRIDVEARTEGCAGRAQIDPWVLTAAITPRFIRQRLRSPPSLSGLIMAKYACELKTAHGATLAILTLRRDDDAWRIDSFYVARPRLARD